MPVMMTQSMIEGRNEIVTANVQAEPVGKGGTAGQFPEDQEPEVSNPDPVVMRPD